MRARNTTTESAFTSFRSGLSRRWRLVLSLAIVIHLWAVLAEPIRFQTRGPFRPSPAAEALYWPVGPYAEFMYLTHGYAFFAPDPGPSHLLRVTTDPQGLAAASRYYPDLSLDRPRLLYHRHFMLSEFLHNLYPPPLPLGIELNVEERQAYAAQRAVYDAVRDSMKQHLVARAGGSEVQLERVEHRMPGLPEFLEERIGLRDPRLYRPLSDDDETPMPMIAPTPALPGRAP